VPRLVKSLNTPWALALALALFVVLNAFLIYRYQQRLEDQAAETSVGVNSVASEETVAPPEQGSATSESSFAPVAEREVANDEEAAAPEENALTTTEEADAVRVVVRVDDAPSWLRVQEDRLIVLDQMSEPGFSQEFVADQAIRIQADNAGAVRVEVDGRDLGPLGADGEVTTRTYTTQEGPEASE
jgi:hypothetical protein